MTALHLDPQKTALVLIDLQKGIMCMPAVPHSAQGVIQRSSLMARPFAKEERP
jgi:nicotinamidase-related amidase